MSRAFLHVALWYLSHICVFGCLVCICMQHSSHSKCCVCGVKLMMLMLFYLIVVLGFVPEHGTIVTLITRLRSDHKAQ